MYYTLIAMTWWEQISVTFPLYVTKILPKNINLTLPVVLLIPRA